MSLLDNQFPRVSSKLPLIALFHCFLPLLLCYHCFVVTTDRIKALCIQGKPSTSELQTQLLCTL